MIMVKYCSGPSNKANGPKLDQ